MSAQDKALKSAWNRNAYKCPLGHTGQQFDQCSANILHSSKECPQSLLDLPYGHGITMWDLGAQTAFMQRYSQNREHYKQTIANLLPNNLSANGRVDICLFDDAHGDWDSPKHVMIAVTGYDESARAEMHRRLQQTMPTTPNKTVESDNAADAADKDTQPACVFTVSDMLGQRWHQTCDNASRRLRKQICDAVLNHIQPNRQNLPLKTHNFDLCNFTPCTDGYVCVGVGQNIGRQVAVYHSPKQGYTVFPCHKNNSHTSCHWQDLLVTPAENGLVAKINTDSGNAENLRNLIKTMSTKADQDHRDMHTAVGTLENNFVSVFQNEDVYRSVAPMQVQRVARSCTLQLVAGCPSTEQLKPAVRTKTAPQTNLHCVQSDFESKEAVRKCRMQHRRARA